MTRDHQPLSDSPDVTDPPAAAEVPDVVVKALAELERPLAPAEFAAFLASETTPEEMAEKRSLIEWFMRRYPTPAGRLAYNRRYVASVRRMRGGGG